MLHPVGPQNLGVYWRRRLLLLGVAVIVIVLLARVFWPSGGGKSEANTPPAVPRTSSGAPSAQSGAAASTGTSGAEPSRTAASHASAPPTTAAPTSTGSIGTGTAGTARRSATPPSSAGHAKTAPSSAVTSAAACTTGELSISAVAGQATYQVGNEPVLSLQVTNTTHTPCVQNLADSQVVLEIYNGESRVWGSHDCEIEPGTSPHTIAAGQSVQVSIVWSGLSSEPNCAGTRQRVGAGTYTLYALLDGSRGKAAQFAIT